MTVIGDPKTFDQSKDFDNNLNHEIKLIVKSNGSVAENKIKNETEQLLPKYKHRNGIHEHGKQQNE